MTEVESGRRDATEDIDTDDIDADPEAREPDTTAVDWASDGGAIKPE